MPLYPKNWEEIASRVKDDAGWKCIRCGHPHDYPSRHVLTVHHADRDTSNNRWWNLLALCQRCHLSIQGRVVMDRQWMLTHTTWFKPYVAGYYAYIAGLDRTREEIEEHLDDYLLLGQPWLRPKGEIDGNASECQYGDRAEGQGQST